MAPFEQTPAERFDQHRREREARENEIAHVQQKLADAGLLKTGVDISGGAGASMAMESANRAGARELTPQEWLHRRANQLQAEADALRMLADSLPPRMPWEATIALRNLIMRSIESPVR